jgi:hypothetical protein
VRKGHQPDPVKEIQSAEVPAEAPNGLPGRAELLRGLLRPDVKAIPLVSYHMHLLYNPVISIAPQ